MKNSLKWKDVYKNYKDRRYQEFVGIKKEDVEIESNPSELLKTKKYYILLITLIIIAVLFFTFRNDLKIGLAAIAFMFAIAGMFFAFNYYKIAFKKEGLYIKFGIQQGTFSYDRIKSIYISRFNDSSYLFSIRTYNVVIRYVDNFNRLKELFFDATFLNKEQLIKFLDNVEVKDVETSRYKNFERFKLLKKILKILLIVAFLIVIGTLAYIRLYR
jgi:hypothetical protein